MDNSHNIPDISEIGTGQGQLPHPSQCKVGPFRDREGATLCALTQTPQLLNQVTLPVVPNVRNAVILYYGSSCSSDPPPQNYCIAPS